jgi:hypothetical protein
VQTSLGPVVATNLNGWFGTKISGAGNPDLVANNGSSSSGALYNYGSSNAPANTNRSLGALATGTTTTAFGALISNNTGTTLNSIILSFTGKFWRSSTSVANFLQFAYGVVDGTTVNNNNFLTTVAATNLPSANVVGPAPVVSNGPLDGNDSTNQVLLSNVVIPVQLLAGETMFIRWQDFDNAGSDAGLAIDDLSLTASTSLPTPSLGSVTINPFSLTESQAEVASSVVSEGGSPLTAPGLSIPRPSSIPTRPSEARTSRRSPTRQRRSVPSPTR